MSQTYAAKRRAEAPIPAQQTAPSGPSLAQLRAGATLTQEQMGHRVDLPEAIRAKMEASFGADLSGVQLYESQTVADAGAQAMTMGNKIGFAPGRLDFVSSAGQALLGHELSHVVSQARGEISGSGFLSDRTLEARADREGALAAAGESVYTGPVSPLSVSAAASAAGPMQAKKPKKEEQQAVPAAPDYDSAAMGATIQALSPVLQQQVSAASQNAPASSGGRFAFIRNKNPETDPYFKHLRNAGAGVSEAYSRKNFFRKEDAALPAARSYNSLKRSDPNDAQAKADMLAYQKAALPRFDAYLETLSQSPEALDALRQSADMYESLGTYSDTNKAGMVGGREEALHRAVNDMMLRSLSADFSNAHASLAKNAHAVGGKYKGQKVSKDLVERSTIVNQAMMSMQGNVLAQSIGGMGDEGSSEYELALRDRMNAFFQNSGLMGGQANVPQVPAPAPVPAPPAGVMGPGEKTTATDPRFAYQRAPVPQTVDLEKTPEDQQLAFLYHRIKNPDPDDTPEKLSIRKRLFAERLAASRR